MSVRANAPDASVVVTAVPLPTSTPANGLPLVNKKGTNKFNKNKENNDSSGSINISGDNLTDRNNASSNINENLNTLKILYVFDEFHQQYVVEKQNQNVIINPNQNAVGINNIINTGTITNNDNSTISNNINTNTVNTAISPSPNNISSNTSFIFSKKYNPNL